MEITYEQIKEILAETAQKQQASAEHFDREMNKLQASIADTGRLVKQNQKQLGELGNKWGSYTEGLAFPSVARIMTAEFGMETVMANVKSQRAGETIEIDALGSANGSTNRVIVGEIKSHFREEHLDQLENICTRLIQFMPEHRGKQVNGMVICVKGEANAIQKAANHGVYVVRANDENFKLLSPKNFVVRDFAK